jgi:D-alanyl-D-alanine carboxypeptidase (penicillin-binding protein 5/6)
MLAAMRSISPITAHQKIHPIIRRHWRAGLAVLAGLLVVILATAPWQGSTARQPTADGAASSQPATGGSAAPATPPGAAAPKQSAPAAVAVNRPIDLTTPGKTKMPWPAKGQTAIGVVGVGNFGHSGRQVSIPTASVAKAMTAYLILKHHPMNTHSQGPVLHVSYQEARAFNHQVALGQSLVPVRSGEALTERQALQALMLASADNMAQILGRWDAGNVPAFLKMMNAEARNLGMLHTRYTDPSGYDKRTHSTAEDQMKLAAAALRLPSFQQITSQKTAVIPVAGKIKNFNALLGEPGVVGIKTGSMSAAGGCLSFAAKQKVGGRTVTIVGTVLGQRSGQIGDLHQAFVSSHNLLAAARHALKPVKIIKKGQVVSGVPGSRSVLIATRNVTIPGWAGMVVQSQITASVKPGATNGSYVGWLKVGTVGSTPLAVTNPA